MTVLDPALHTALRALKLPGMLEHLDARLAQARAGQLGHLDFLQLLCEDEIARRESAALARRLRLARFEEQVTIEAFDFTANPKLPAGALRDLAALRWLDTGESVILYGPTVIHGLDPEVPRFRRSRRCCDRCDVGRLAVGTGSASSELSS